MTTKTGPNASTPTVAARRIDAVERPRADASNTDEDQPDPDAFAEAFGIKEES